MIGQADKVYRQGETDMLYRSFCPVRLSVFFGRKIIIFLQIYVLVCLSVFFTHLFFYFLHICNNLSSSYNIYVRQIGKVYIYMIKKVKQILQKKTDNQTALYAIINQDNISDVNKKRIYPKKSDSQTGITIPSHYPCKRFPLFDVLLFAKVFREVCENPHLFRVKPCYVKAHVLIKSE